MFMFNAQYDHVVYIVCVCMVLKLMFVVWVDLCKSLKQLYQL